MNVVLQVKMEPCTFSNVNVNCVKTFENQPMFFLVNFMM
jgi:hypothetical protein